MHLIALIWPSMCRRAVKKLLTPLYTYMLLYVKWLTAQQCTYEYTL